MPFIVLNFIALGQTIYEKTVTNFFYTLQYFGAPGGPTGPKFTSLGRVRQGSLYQPTKFNHLLTTSLWDMCCKSSSISSTAWPTDTQTTRMWANAHKNSLTTKKPLNYKCLVHQSFSELWNYTLLPLCAQIEQWTPVFQRGFQNETKLNLVGW